MTSDRVPNQNKVTSVLNSILSSKEISCGTDMVMVGGQALYFWVARYLWLNLTDKQLSQIESSDIDFFANKASFKEIIENWNPSEFDVGVRVASIDDNTPNIGVIYVFDKSGMMIVDFLSTVNGITDREVKSESSTFNIGPYPLTILSPHAILKSRLANMFHLGYNEHKVEREMTRISILGKVIDSYIEELIDEGQVKKAMKVMDYTLSLHLSKDGRKAYSDYGIEVINDLNLDNHRLPTQFRDKRIPQLLTQIDAARMKDRNRRINSGKHHEPESN